MTAAQLNTMFTTYGDAGDHWTGGDGTTSVLLPDGRVAWLFSDTFLGKVNADKSRPPNTTIVNNTIVVQDGTSLTSTLTGGGSDSPLALARPNQAGEALWVADGLVEGGKLKVLYNRYKIGSTSALDFELRGTVLVTFGLPALNVESVVDMPVSAKTAWGMAVLADGGYTYIYGTTTAPGKMKFGQVARVATGNIGAAWEYWTGAGWSSTESSAARVLSGVGVGFAVQKIGAEYVLVTHENNLVFDPRLVAYTSSSPTGPFNGPRYLLKAPEVVAGGQKIVYNAQLHPALARPGKLLVSYDVNSLKYADNIADVRLYRPRFVEIDWPPAAPGAGVPAAGGQVAASGQDDYADLSWPAITGATGYRVYQRDVTAGQTHFVRLLAEPTTTSARAASLVPGHQYEFKVSGVNGVGEGATGPVVAFTPVSTKKAADVIAGAGAAGAISGQYIVKLKGDGAFVGRVTDYATTIVTQAGGQLLDTLEDVTHGFVASLTEQQAVNLAAHPDVEWVSQDAKITEKADVQANAPPHLSRISKRDLPVDGTYRSPNGGAVRAYVIDSGLRSTHAEFAGRVATGRSIPDRSSSTPDCADSHGTSMASALAGSSTGVAKAATIVPVKIWQCGNVDYSTASWTAKGLEWIVKDAKDKGPAVVSYSNIPRKSSTQVIDDAVLDVVRAGLTVVVAAGNDGVDACSVSPAKLSQSSSVISVGASVPTTDLVPGYSNKGSCVTLYAPSDGASLATSSGDTSYASKSGTSYSGPMVAGAAAIVLAAHPGYSPAEVKDALVEASTKDRLPQGTTPNRLLFVESVPTAAPTSLSATANADATITLSWTTVPSEARYQVSMRDVTLAEASFTPWSTQVKGATATSARLQPEHTYEFKVAAVNSAGKGPDSNVASAKARLGLPPAPAGLAAAPQADGTIDLSWNALQGAWYWVYQRDVTNAETTYTKLPLPVTGTSMTAGYLARGHTYEFRVSAFNESGEGPQSTPVSAVSTLPVTQAPSVLRAQAGNGEVTLTWNASATPDVWYLVYQRDVTAGETSFVQLPLPVTSCCTMTAGYLVNDHQYEFRVTATAEGVESAASNTVSATPRPPLPPVITGLAASPQPSGSIKLTWTSGGDGLWYVVYQRDVSAGTGFTKLPLPVTTCCTMTAGYLTNGHIYEFRVAGLNGRGEGPQSAVVQARAQVQPPGAPQNLRGESSGNASINLDWDAPASDVSYWVYQRDVTAGGSFAKLPLPVTSCCAMTAGYLVSGHVYAYKVTAENAGGEGPASTIVQVTATGGLPAAPSGLTATAGDGQAILRWTASSTANVFYSVYQRDTTNGQSWQKLPLPVTSCCTMTAGYLVNGHTYEFKVVAGNSAGNSAASNIDSARPLPPLPGAPSGLTGAVGDGQVTLRWTASPSSNVWYVVEQRTGSGDWKRLPLPITTCCTMTAGYLINGASYSFRVRATNMAGDSGASNVVTLTPMPPFPQAPTSLTGVSGDGQAKLSWTASSTPNVWYWVEMKSPSGNWQRLPLPITSCCKFTGGLLVNGVTYSFRVRAFNAAGVSAASNVVNVRPMPPFPTAPSTLLYSLDPNHGRINFSWTQSSTKGVYYRIYMQDYTRGSGWTNGSDYHTGSTGAVQFLQGGDKYAFKVVAWNLAGESGATNVVVTRMPYTWSTIDFDDYRFPAPVSGSVGWTEIHPGAVGFGGMDDTWFHAQTAVYIDGELAGNCSGDLKTAGDGSWRFDRDGCTVTVFSSSFLGSPKTVQNDASSDGPNGFWGSDSKSVTHDM